MAALYALSYHSNATAHLTEEGLRWIFDWSRTYNTQHQITGLLYNRNRFMQFLEGLEDAIKHLFASIQRDPRHTDVTLLNSAPAERREFPDWAMGFVNASTDDPALPGALDPAQPDFLHECKETLSAETRLLIVQFVAR